MCGIVGQFAYNARAVDRDALQKASSHMIPRGPDGAGEWYGPDNQIGFVHRRLSIIDVSNRAAQPMLGTSGNTVITFNGEIYNYPELRADLSQRGYQFRTHSDTEVLLALYDAKKEAMVHDLRGMFAFVLWDNEDKSLFLARDPYGIKPLYYADTEGIFKFASQVKTITTCMNVPEDIDPAGALGFFLTGSVPEPYTTNQNVRALPAGSTMRVSQSGPNEPRPYFSVADVFSKARNIQNRMPEVDKQGFIRTALLDSVRHHLVSDVPVGLFLSAGIDSCALLGLMREVSTSDIQTVTLSFEEFTNSQNDEAPLAKEVADLYGVRHHRRVVTEAEFRTDLPKILDAMDQPSIDGLNTWFVSKAAKELGLKVAISGLGGDELFGGYPTFKTIPASARLLKAPLQIPGAKSLLSQFADRISKQFPHKFSPKLGDLFRYGDTYAGAYLVRRGLFMPKSIADVFSPNILKEGMDRLAPFDQLTAALDGKNLNSFTKVATLEASFYMRNQLLRDTDWSSMAHSLEVRTPLVDRVLLETLAPVLSSTRKNVAKIPLAQSPKTPLPTSITGKKKTGFSTPIADWLERDERTQAWRQQKTLANPACPWARRWAYTIADHAGILP
jgi:asparagine synthase (glutamine-hydrolysing)